MFLIFFTGLSAFNHVERRLAPLTKALAGYVCPHDSHGTHLDSSGNTINVELAKKNFKTGGLGLCEIWNQIMINGYKVDSKWMDIGSEFIPEEVDVSFMSEHVTQTRYGL